MRSLIVLVLVLVSLVSLVTAVVGPTLGGTGLTQTLQQTVLEVVACPGRQAGESADARDIFWGGNRSA